MRADMSIFIFIIVAVVLAGAILVMGMGGIGQVGAGLEQFLGVGAKVESEFTPKDIKTICETWLASGANQYDPETIANLQVTDSFKPFPRFWDDCGQPMELLVTVCKSGSDDCEQGIVSTAKAYGADFGKPGVNANGRDVVECCVKSCGIAIQLYEQCQLSSASEADLIQCFNSAMLDTSPRC
jgi:hypothetical protein